MSLPPTPDHTLAQAFIQFSLESGVLKFGSFTTKAGRQSPYFFNAGLFDDGAKLSRLAGFYAQALLQSDVQFDMIFGPAYKGIPLGAAVAVELARSGRNLPFAYNRKEAKDHGEGGSLVGAPLKGRVLIVDDVMSAGTAVRESIALIEKAGPQPMAWPWRWIARKWPLKSRLTAVCAICRTALCNMCVKPWVSKSVRWRN